MVTPCTPPSSIRQRLPDHLHTLDSTSPLSAACLRAIFENVHDGIALFSAGGDVVEINRSFFEMLGYPDYDKAVANAHDLLSEFELQDEYGARVPDSDLPFARALRGEETHDVVFHVVNSRSGRSFFGNYSHTPLTDTDGTIQWVLVTLHDVTHLKVVLQEQESMLRESLEIKKRLEALAGTLEDQVTARTRQVTSLSKALNLAEQRERARFSRILHEDLQQILLASKMRLDLIGAGAVTEESTVEDILEVSRLIRKAVNISKSLALEINPPILDSEGLDAALKWLADHLQHTHGFPIRTDISTRLDMVRKEMGVLVVQVVREMLVSALKTTELEDLQLSASRDGHDLIVVIRTTGTEPARKVTRINDFLGPAWNDINERVALFGGSVGVVKLPNKTTTTTLVLPVME